MEFDATTLSRVQFGFTLGFHILFPTFTIGLSGFLVILHGAWLWTGTEAYLRLYRFWLKLFALGFGMGVVSGVVLSFEFGTNFSRFAQATGNILGPLHGYEVLMAFFLEASFLPLMLFGWGRVGPRLQFLATVIVAIGTVLSAFWILVANSWMHTPAGYDYANGIFTVRDWWAVIFNPSMPYRFLHMTMASLLTVAFVIAGVSAWHLRRGVHPELARRALSVAMVSAAVFAPTQIVLGDLHGLQTARDQPMKVAAMEALWTTTAGAPFVLFAWPDAAAETNRYELAIPRAASLILTHDIDGVVPGLNEVAPRDRPNVAWVFFSFRVMLAIGFYLTALAGIGLVLRWRRRLYDSDWFQRLLIGAIPLGFIAVIAGWLVTETGRQPWAVHGLLRTADATTPLAAGTVAGSLALIMLVYAALLAAFLYFVYRLARAGPEHEIPERVRHVPRTAWRLTH